VTHAEEKCFCIVDATDETRLTVWKLTVAIDCVTEEH